MVAVSTDTLALTVSIISLLTSIAVGIAQVQLWRRSGPVLSCAAHLVGDNLVVAAVNQGRAEASITGFGVILPDEIEYAWITATADRYWPGGGKPASSTRPFPHVLRPNASASWYIPIDELRSALTAFSREGQSVRPYIETAGGRVAAQKPIDWKTLESVSP